MARDILVGGLELIGCTTQGHRLYEILLCLFRGLEFLGFTPEVEAELEIPCIISF
jgi:hypothetical protein